MDKKLILAVAGSGKTRLIVNSINESEKALIITYTVNNFVNLRNRIVSKFGYFPENVRLYTFFGFLHSFCFKPLLLRQVASLGINWETPPSFTQKLKRNDERFYLDSSRRLYHNRISKTLELFNVLDQVNLRLERYFDVLYFDEIQDLSGHDFNFLNSIVKAQLRFLLVGDFFQHTYDTSRDGNVNSTLHGDYTKYLSRFSAMGLTIDTKSLSLSYRCSPSVCNFVSNSLGIPIFSAKTDNSKVILLESKEDTESVFNSNSIVKLFYQSRSKYPCFSRNWGESKGMDCFENICVVLNSTTWKFFKDGLNSDLTKLNPRTKNKLYVACTRAKGDLFLIPENLVKSKKTPR